MAHLRPVLTGTGASDGEPSVDRNDPAYLNSDVSSVHSRCTLLEHLLTIYLFPQLTFSQPQVQHANTQLVLRLIEAFLSIDPGLI